MAVELKVPEVGESISEVVIGQWAVKEGNAVAKEDPVVEIETDKITLELPAPVDGKVTQILKQQGEEAKVGDVIGYMEEGEAPQASGSGDADTEAQAASSKQAEPSTDQGKQTQTTPAEETEPAPQPPSEAPDAGNGESRIMPAAQRLLDEHGLSASQVPASGPGGRLLKEDVQKYVQSAGAGSSSESTASAVGDRQEEVVPMTPLRKRIAERLVDAQQNAALLTTFNEIDMSQVMALRSQYKDEFAQHYNVKLGFMSFFVKAVIDALKQFPAVNGEVRGNDIVYKNFYDIGIAVGSGKGLVVPVLRDADRMSFAEIELAIADFAQRIKSNKIKLEELTGGTFTITNGGVYGSLLSTPIINPPQSGVLGMHSIQQRPIAVDGEVVIRPMMYVAMTYDHRLIDGREAVGFLVRLKQAIENPSRMLMEI